MFVREKLRTNTSSVTAAVACGVIRSAMPTLSEWKSLSEEAREDFLNDPQQFTSYDERDYDLANSVVEDLRTSLNFEIGDITIGGKGGYFILLVEVPAREYEHACSSAIDKHLGFQVVYCKSQKAENV